MGHNLQEHNAMNTNPTPGPWRVVKEMDGETYSIWGGYKRVAGTNNYADACLIASAPDAEGYPGIASDLNTALLALERISCLDPLDVGHTSWYPTDAGAECFQKAKDIAREALAKIKG
jgi:ribonuclease HI